MILIKISKTTEREFRFSIPLVLWMLTIAFFLSCEHDGKSHDAIKTIERERDIEASNGPARVDKVVFILLDTARADHFSSYGYAKKTTPRIDGIAAQGVLFLNHYSQSHATGYSIPQIMTGKYYNQGILSPMSELNGKRIDYPFIEPDPSRVLLPELMEKAGFLTACFTAHFRIDGKSVLGKSFDRLYPATPKKNAYSPAEEIVPDVRKWITDHRDEKFFVYLHMMDPHLPHVMKEEHKEFVDPDYDWETRFRKGGSLKPRKIFPWTPRKYMGNISTPALNNHFNSLYDGDLKHADKWVGKLWDTIEELGIDEDTLLIITADHGEELGEHGWYGHIPRGPWDTVFHIPLIMVWKGNLPAGRRIDSFTQNIDLTPTLSDMLNAPPPEGKTMDGRNLTAVLENPDAEIRNFACGVMDSYGFVRTRNWAAGWMENDAEFLYDMSADPDQKNNLAKTNDEKLAYLKNMWKRETGESMEKWLNLPFVEPKNVFIQKIHDKIKNIDLRYIDWNDEIKIKPGQWVGIDPYVIGRGGGGKRAAELLIEFNIPNYSYRLDLSCVKSRELLKGKSSFFQITVGDGKTRKISTTSETGPNNPVSEKKDMKWNEIYIHAGDVEVKDETLKIRIKPSTNPNNWVVIKNLKFTRSGVEKSGLTVEERKKLEALGYLH